MPENSVPHGSLFHELSFGSQTDKFFPSVQTKFRNLLIILAGSVKFEFLNSERNFFTDNLLVLDELIFLVKLEKSFNFGSF